RQFKLVAAELRMFAGAGEATDIRHQFDSVRLQQRKKFIPAARRMADGPDLHRNSSGKACAWKACVSAGPMLPSGPLREGLPCDARGQHENCASVPCASMAVARRSRPCT